MFKPIRLLIITQKMNAQDSVLGFFVGWVSELAKHFPEIIVICLEKGEYDLPTNVRVLSLGKEEKQPRFQYLWRFCKYLWQERGNYDAVFVHMNQEYVLLAGWWWRLWGKTVGLWRNHHAGSWLTNLAVFFCHQVFCTSKYSYTARFKKTKLMPVGVDLTSFKPNPTAAKQSRSIIFLGRLSPVKKQKMFIEALIRLRHAGEKFNATIVGDYLPADRDYHDQLVRLIEENDLTDQIKILSGVPHAETIRFYQTNEWAVNLSSSGMYDKIIFEALACGTPILATNQNLVGLLDERLVINEPTVEDLAARLKLLLNSDDATRTGFINQAQKLADANSLAKLAATLHHAYQHLLNR